jgi:hypothetical protein
VSKREQPRSKVPKASMGKEISTAQFQNFIPF